RGPCGVDRLLKRRCRTEIDSRLYFALAGVPHIALTRAVGEAAAVDEMLDAAHGISLCLVGSWPLTSPREPRWLGGSSLGRVRSGALKAGWLAKPRKRGSSGIL